MSIDDRLAAINETLALTMRATVYIGSTFTTVDRADLPCSLDPVNIQPAATGGGRTELASRGHLEWARSYQPPLGARVMVDAYPGQRWTIVAGTVWPSFGPGGGRLSWAADVVKAG